MDIYPATLANVSRDDLFAAVQDAQLTTHVGNAPTQIFMVGSDTHGHLLEITTVVRQEDVFVVHAGPARAESLEMLRFVQSEDLPAPSHGDEKVYGVSADEWELTDTTIEELHKTAEDGYDVPRLLTRTRPGRPAPMTVGTVVRIGLEERLLAKITLAATNEQQSEAEYVVTALRQLVNDEAAHRGE